MGCQCDDNDFCHGQCCDNGYCTSNPGCGYIHDYDNDDDLRSHKSQYQCNCQCDDDGCHGQCCDANGCTSNPGCSSSSLELWGDNNYHGDDDVRAHKSQYQCNCQCDDDGCQGQCCDSNGCTSNPGCSRSSLELWSDTNYHGDDDIRAHKSLQCQCQCQNGVCQGNGCSNPACWRWF